MNKYKGIVVARLKHLVKAFHPNKIVILSRCDDHEFDKYSVSDAKLTWFLTHTKYGETMAVHRIMQHLINTL